MIPFCHDVTAIDHALIFIKSVFATTGILDTVLGDQDPKFTSDFWVEILKQLKTMELLTTWFCPRTDDGIEGKHGVINPPEGHS